MDVRVIPSGWSAARNLVLRYGWNAAAYQILNPGLQLWFSARGDAVAGYAAYHRVRVIAGAPVCQPERLQEVARELEAAAATSGERLLYFGAGTRLEQAYATRTGRCLALLGAQPVWDPLTWSNVVARKASLRAQLHRATNKDVHVREWSVGSARDVAPLRAVQAEWLATRGLPPLGFMTTPDVLDALADRRVFVAEQGSARRIVAFLVATPVPARSGWLVEQWPRVQAAPNGTTHLLVDAAMRAFAEAGSRFATLGLAPLSEQAGAIGRSQPKWLGLVLRWVRAHGRRFYNFRGLEAFKASLQPARWEPIYAIAPGRRFRPAMLTAVAGVFCRGSPWSFLATAVTNAAVQELRTLRPRFFRDPGQRGRGHRA